MRTNVYVDGFNLYYGALKRTPWKWLDIEAMCKAVLAVHHQIHRIRYFTARVRSRPGNPQVHNRQEAYLRALGTQPKVMVQFGHYLEHKTYMPRADGRGTVEVIKTDEKGSDVNLATAMLVDAFDKDFEAAVVVSNDSDLAEPIRVVRTKFGFDVVGVLNPHPKQAVSLKKVAKFCLPIRQDHLSASQLPPTLTDSAGRTIHKPDRW